MDYAYDKQDKKLLRLADKIIKKWKKNLQLDPIWNISASIISEDEMAEGALARVDTSIAEYFVAIIEISDVLILLGEDKFYNTVNELVCHELTHLTMVDFFRTAQLIAGKKIELNKELKYKYEQSTSRLQRAFINMDKKIIQLENKMQNE